MACVTILSHSYLNLRSMILCQDMHQDGMFVRLLAIGPSSDWKRGLNVRVSISYKTAAGPS